MYNLKVKNIKKLYFAKYAFVYGDVFIIRVCNVFFISYMLRIISCEVWQQFPDTNICAAMMIRFLTLNVRGPN